MQQQALKFFQDVFTQGTGVTMVTLNFISTLDERYPGIYDDELLGTAVLFSSTAQTMPWQKMTPSQAWGRYNQSVFRDFPV
jgi:hypothetical protein